MDSPQQNLIGPMLVRSREGTCRVALVLVRCAIWSIASNEETIDIQSPLEHRANESRLGVY